MREFITSANENLYTVRFTTDDRKAYEQVESLCRILVDGKDGEAIPIKWINMWLLKKCIYMGSHNYVK